MAAAHSATGTIAPPAAAPNPARVTAGFLLGRLRSILTIAVVIAALAVAGWALWPAKYKAVALVALDPQTPQLTAEREMPQSSAQEGAAVVSLAEVATTDTILVPIVERLQLVGDPEFDDGTGGGAAAPAEQLRRSLKVGRRGLSFLIEVTAQSKDPDKAARIANAVAEALVQRQKALRREASGGIAEAINSRLADLRAAVVASEKAVADYRLQNNLLDVSPDGRVGLKRLNSMAEQVGPLRARLEEARARFEKLKKAKSGDDIDTNLYRSERMSELIAQRNEERRQMAAAARTYGPRHPSIDAGQARLAALDQAFAAERTRITEQAKAEVDILSAQLATYEGEIATRTKEQLVTDQKEVVLRDLIRQMEADRSLYEKFLARQKTTQEQSDLAQPEAVVVSAAQPPSRSGRPSLPVVGLAGLIGGLGAGALWTLFRLRRPEDAPIVGPDAAASAPAPHAPPPVAPPPPAPLATPVAPVSAAAPERPQAPPPPLMPPAERPAADGPAAPAALRRDPPIPPPAAIPVTITTVAAPTAAAPTVATPVAAAAEPAPRRRRRELEAAAPTALAAPPVAAPPVPTPLVAGPTTAPAPSPPTAAAEIEAEAEGDDLDRRLAELAARPREEAPQRSPERRRRRLLRVLEDRGVPLVADLSRPDEEAPAVALAAFARVLADHADRAPGSTLLALAVSGAAPTALADTLADAIDRGDRHVAVVDDATPDPTPPDGGWDLVIACSDAGPALDGDAPEDGDLPFVLVVVDVLEDGRDRLDAVLARWTADPERAVVAAFDLGRSVG